MTQSQTIIDRLRIERAVWVLDARLQDLPRRSRIAKRRELRQNLRAAADEIGTRQAVRQLGDLRGLAVSYLAAEYGDVSRRPSWTAAAVWIALIDIFMMVLDHAATSAFRAGVTATTPHATGSVRWGGVPYLISDRTFTYLGGKATTLGGAWTAWVYALMLGGAVVAGRLWLLLPALRRRQPLGAADPGD
jgi:hypothetical protein